MIVAGLSHLGRPEPFLQHLPSWTPWPDATVAVTGVIEMALGALMIWSGLRDRVGLVLVAYLLAVFPANVYVAIEGIDVQGQPDGPYPWLRLPLQAVFVFLGWWSTGTPAGDPVAAASASGAGEACSSRRRGKTSGREKGRPLYTRVNAPGSTPRPHHYSCCTFTAIIARPPLL